MVLIDQEKRRPTVHQDVHPFERRDAGFHRSLNLIVPSDIHLAPLEILQLVLWNHRGKVACARLLEERCICVGQEDLISSRQEESSGDAPDTSSAAWGFRRAIFKEDCCGTILPVMKKTSSIPVSRGLKVDSCSPVLSRP
jgi:hypothetical protein